MGTNHLIRRASENDLETVLRLINDAAAWLRRQGIDQWSKPWPTREARDQRVHEGLRAGKTWIAWDHDVPAATITVDCEGSPKLWTEGELDEAAVYAHRLVVDRRYAGNGLGAQLMDWAGLRARQDWGASLIRIDVWTTNTRLQDYYISQDFRTLRMCSDPEYPAGVLMQKPISRIKPRTPSFGHGVVNGAGTPGAIWNDTHPVQQWLAQARHGAVHDERLAACAVHRRFRLDETNAVTDRAARPRVGRPSRAIARRVLPLMTLTVAQLALLAFEIGLALTQFAGNSHASPNVMSTRVRSHRAESRRFSVPKLDDLPLHR